MTDQEFVQMVARLTVDGKTSSPSEQSIDDAFETLASLIRWARALIQRPEGE